MDILQKLHEIEKEKCIYNIHYCKAGVGFSFYNSEKQKGEDFKTGLTLDKYYPTFEKAVEAEYDQLSNSDKSNNGRY